MATAAITLAWISGVTTAISAYTSIRQQRKLKNAVSSYTYGEGALTTNVSNTAPVPIIYGTVKVAGNQIYTRLSGDEKVQYKLVAVAEGPVSKLYDLEFDDESADSSDYKNVSYNFYLGDGKQQIDSRVDGQTNEDRAYSVGGLKHIAYAAMEVEANENLSGSFNVTMMVDGSIVKIYKNAEDLSDYTTAWTDNPSWCILDFMTRYNGCGMGLEEIDVQSFIDAAEFFENNNYTLNLCLDEQRSRLEWIQYMMNCCRSMLVYRAGKYSIFVEKAAPVVQSFDTSCIHDLSVWFSPLTEVPDIYRITYIDPDNEWVKVQAEASLSPDNYLRTQPSVEVLELLGVTNFDQASRLAWFYLNQVLSCQTFVEFYTDRRALNRTVGDVIEVTDYVLEFQKKKFRITKIEDVQESGIKLTAREYNEDIYSEQRGAANPVINVTKLTDPQAKPPEILYIDSTQEYYILTDKTVVSNVTLQLAYEDWAYNKGFHVWYREASLSGSEGWKYGGFYENGQYYATVHNMQIFETYKFRFQNVSIYNKFSSYTYSPDIYITGNNEPPEVPQNFWGEEVTGGFSFTWDEGEPDVEYYELYLSSVSDANRIARVYGNSYRYDAQVGEYAFLLVAVDTAGNRSQPAYLELEIARPSDVSGFDCVQNERNIEFHWNKVEGATYYVLKEGDDWEYGNILATSAGQFFSYPFAEATYTTFWMKAYNEYGVASVYPAYCTLETASIPNRNMIMEYDAVEDGWSGRMFNTHINATGLQLDTGKVHGDYIYKMHLDQEYCARNWVEKTIKPVSEALELMWKDAHFVWGSETANRRVWFPLGTDDLFNAWTDITTYDEATKDDIVDRFSMNSTLVSDNNKSPMSGYGKASYENGRYDDKAYIYDGCSKVKWDNIGIGTTFSISFTLHTPFNSANDYTILTLKNASGDYLWLHYRALDEKGNDKFVVTLSNGTEYTLDDYSGDEDYMTFVISQGDGYFTFVLYSLMFDSYEISRKKYTDCKKYTQLALYKDI